MEELTMEWAERLLALKEPTAEESADIKAFIREKGPLAKELMDRWPLEADEVYFEDARPVVDRDVSIGR